MATRKSERMRIAVAAQCRVMAGAILGTQVTELSEGGCQITDSQRHLARGQRLELVLGDRIRVRCRVVHLEGSDVGLAFDAPLAEESLASLQSGATVELRQRTNAPDPVPSAAANTLRFC